MVERSGWEAWMSGSNPVGAFYPSLWCARRRYRALRAPCGAVSGTRYVSMRGLLGSRRVPYV
eukprot:2057449-Prymnesium_polylepis.1